jgi:hypothetical protein
MSDGFIMPLGPYGDVTVVIDPGGVQPFGLQEQFEKVENALPQLSTLILNVAKGFHDSVVVPMKADASGPAEFAIEFSVNFSVEGGAPFLQVGVQSGLNITLSWK